MRPGEQKLALVVWVACLCRAIVMPIRWCFQDEDERFQTYLAEDQAWNAVANGWADEAISARVHREKHTRWERFINWAFSDPEHCLKAFWSEMRGTQNAPEYHNG